MTSIPVVDFDDVFSCTDLSSCREVEDIHVAFTTIGYIFVKNHGINRKLVDDVFRSSETFFTLPEEIKLKYAYNWSGKEESGKDGYLHYKQESLDVTKPPVGDLKESFDICGFQTLNYPDEVPEFKLTIVKLYEELMVLAKKLLEIMGYALKLDNPLFFQQAHQKMGHGSNQNYTGLRVTYYPPVPPDSEIKPGQIRCGEHVDFNSITFLFLDPIGGLQVRNSDGSYFDVPYRPDAVLVIQGAQMEHWTNNKYPAPPHRVVSPSDEAVKETVRQSIGFFVHPDNDVLMKCIDGSDNYPAITAKEATDRRQNAALRKN